MEETKLRNLIVNYLPPNLTGQDFRRLFEPYGPILSSKIVHNQNGKSLCYGFIKYHEPQSALDAIANLNGIRIYNKVLKVAFALPQIPQSQRANNLLIKNLPKTITMDELEGIFKPYGNIVYARILYDPILYTKCSESETQRLSKGIAFVRFEKLVDALHALRSLNNTIPVGFKKPLEIKMTENTSKKSFPDSMMSNSQDLIDSIPTELIDSNQTERLIQSYGQLSEGKNLIVRNISPHFDEESLCALFKPCGNLLWIKIARHRDGTSRQYGFVEMETEQGATRAIQHLNGCFLLGHKLCVKHNHNVNTPPFSIRCDKKFKKHNQLT